MSDMVFFAFGGETLLIASLVLTAAAAGVGAVSAQQAARAQEDAANFNAAVAKNEATAHAQQAAFDAEQIRNKNRRLLGAQRAAYAASGVDPNQGSPLAVAEDTKIQGELEALTAIYTGKIGSSSASAQAKLEKMRGNNARTAGNIGVATSLLGGATQATSIYTNPNFRN